MTIPDFIHVPAPRTITKAEKDLLIEATMEPKTIITDYTIKSKLRTFARAQRTACVAISDFYIRPGIANSLRTAETNKHKHKDITRAVGLAKLYRDQVRPACFVCREIVNGITKLERLGGTEGEKGFNDYSPEYQAEWTFFMVRCGRLPEIMEELEETYGKLHDLKVMMEDCDGVFFDY
jgi:hypothetical protein